MIELDGSVGNGGGQILRTSLALSILQNQPFQIVNIRHNRPKRGLLAQHLVAVEAAATISNAIVSGNELLSSTLTFTPRELSTDTTFKFNIGTAGSASLVLQTILLPLLLLSKTSSDITINIRGGTHNGMSPPYEFLRDTYAPFINRVFGNVLTVSLKRAGLYPVGNGEIQATLRPANLETSGFADFIERGALLGTSAIIYAAPVMSTMVDSQIQVLSSNGVSNDSIEWKELGNVQKNGNVVLIRAEYANVTLIFTSFAEKRKDPADVAVECHAQLVEYQSVNTFADEHMSDQLLLPLAVCANGGRFTVSLLSDHLETNKSTIAAFTNTQIQIEKQADRYLISLTKK